MFSLYVFLYILTFSLYFMFYFTFHRYICQFQIYIFPFIKGLTNQNLTGQALLQSKQEPASQI